MRVLMSVCFDVEPVVIEVEAESLEDAWKRRFDLTRATGLRPASFTVVPTSVETFEEEEAA